VVKNEDIIDFVSVIGYNYNVTTELVGQKPFEEVAFEAI